MVSADYGRYLLSTYSLMITIDPPHEDPVVTGLRQRYHLGERVIINCTSGHSRPPCQLQWYINDEPVPSTASLSPIYQLHENERDSTTSTLDFILTEEYFRKKVVKVKCLATLFTLYWQSNEKSALLEEEKIHNRMLPNIKKLYSEPDSSENIGSSLVSLSWRTYFFCLFPFLKYL